VGGAAAVLGRELGHLLVRPGDPAALAAAWREVLEKRERRAADAALARQRVEAHYALRAMVLAYERIYSATT